MEKRTPPPHAPGATPVHTSTRNGFGSGAPDQAGQQGLALTTSTLRMVLIAGELHVRCSVARAVT